MTVEKQKNQEEKNQKEDQIEKIKRAIWIHDRLIDKNPEIYRAWKELYEQQRNIQIIQGK